MSIFNVDSFTGEEPLCNGHTVNKSLSLLLLLPFASDHTCLKNTPHQTSLYIYFSSANQECSLMEGNKPSCSLFVNNPCLQKKNMFSSL